MSPRIGLRGRGRAVLGGLLLLLPAGGPLAAQRRPYQAPPTHTRVWLSTGVGGSSGRTYSLLAATGQLAFQRRVHYIAVRGAIMGDPFEGGDPGQGDVGVLYGRTLTRRHGHAAAAAGLGAAFFEHTRFDPAQRTIGVPLLAELALQPIPVIGIGIQGFAHLNRTQSWAGAVVFLQLGWMP